MEHDLGLGGDAPVSIIIPTKNRSEFLLRSLRYYASVGYKGAICIGDSSDSTHLDVTKRALDILGSRVNITYKECPGVSEASAMESLLDQVPTECAAFCADDDLLVPSALYKCAAFLNAHQDYVAAHGRILMTSLWGYETYGRMVYLRPFRLPVGLDRPKPSQRLLSFWRVPMVSAQHYVHRVRVWREMYKYAGKVSDRKFNDELIPCSLLVIHGKVKTFGRDLYLVRQAHGRQYRQPGTFDWLASLGWPAAFDRFRRIVTEELSQVESITYDQAVDIVERAFWSFHTDVLQARCRSRWNMSPIAREISRMKVLVAARVTLAKYLNPLGHHYPSFRPIYDALTVVPAEPGDDVDCRE